MVTTVTMLDLCKELNRRENISIQNTNASNNKRKILTTLTSALAIAVLVVVNLSIFLIAKHKWANASGVVGNDALNFINDILPQASCFERKKDIRALECSPITLFGNSGLPIKLIDGLTLNCLKDVLVCGVNCALITQTNNNNTDIYDSDYTVIINNIQDFIIKIEQRLVMNPVFTTFPSLINNLTTSTASNAQISYGVPGQSSSPVTVSTSTSIGGQITIQMFMKAYVSESRSEDNFKIQFIANYDFLNINISQNANNTSCMGQCINSSCVLQPADNTNIIIGFADCQNYACSNGVRIDQLAAYNSVYGISSSNITKNFFGVTGDYVFITAVYTGALASFFAAIGASLVACIMVYVACLAIA